MTVAAIIPRNDYVGTGLVDTYAYGFKIVNQDDLIVIKADTDGVEEVLNLGIDYEVTGVGLINGGTVVLSSDLESGYTLTILQGVPLEQETSIRNDSEYYASIHEDTFDTSRRIDQQIAEALGRALSFKRSSTTTGIYIDDIVADSVLRSNSAGDGLVWDDSSGSSGTTDHYLLEHIGINTHYQIDDHINNTSNPHSVTQSQVGLSNVDNTSDLSKPISTATQTALDAKANTSALSSLVPYTGATSNLDLGTRLGLFGNGLVGAPSLAFSADTNTGVYRPDADTLGFVSGGVETLRIAPNAVVTISGSTYPSFVVQGSNEGAHITAGVNNTFGVGIYATSSNQILCEYDGTFSVFRYFGGYLTGTAGEALATGILKAGYSWDENIAFTTDGNGIAYITNNSFSGTQKFVFSHSIELVQNVATESLTQDTSVEIVINGSTYKLLATAV